MRIIFMGTPEYSLPSLQSVHRHHEVVACFTQPDRPKGRGHKLVKTPVKTLAESLNIPIYQPHSFKHDFDIKLLKNMNPDFILTVAYGLLLPKQVLEIAPCLNAHGSILPKYRGASPMQEAILNGDSTSGVTIFQMDEGMDTGEILLQKEVNIKDQPISVVHDLLSELSAKLFLQVLKDYHTFTPQSQDHRDASYTKKISKEDGLVFWEMSAEEIYRKTLAYTPWPGVSIPFQNELIKLIEVSVASEDDGLPGTVTSANKQGIKVTTGKGAILIKKLQLPGKKMMNVNDYLNGHRLEIGTYLGGN